MHFQNYPNEVNGLLKIVHKYLPEKAKNFGNFHEFLIEFLESKKGREASHKRNLEGLCQNTLHVRKHFEHFLCYVKKYEGSSHIPRVKKRK